MSNDNPFMKKTNSSSNFLSSVLSKSEQLNESPQTMVSTGHSKASEVNFPATIFQKKNDILLTKNNTKLEQLAEEKQGRSLAFQISSQLTDSIYAKIKWKV